MPASTELVDIFLIGLAIQGLDVSNVNASFYHSKIVLSVFVEIFRSDT